MSLSLICLSFFIIAVIYSSVGFGGGSSYIALLLLLNSPTNDVRLIGLVCNIIVVSISCFYFYKSEILKPKEIFPLIILSIPFAFIGGLITLDNSTFKSIAAAALIISSIFMLVNIKTTNRKPLNNVTLTGIGGGIGLLSGFIGIGGGIFLSPILHLTNWSTVKKISSVASFFILVNSTSGLIGLFVNKPAINWILLMSLGISVFIGGQLGNRMNIHILPSNKIKLITAILIAFVGFRILYMQYT